jgi:uncharacterized RDD family membrane protein YckC
MHVWHIRIEQFDGAPVSWRQATIRFMTGLPAWGLLVLSLIRFYVPEQYQIQYFPAWTMALKPIWLLLLAMIWLVLDHWDTSWRDKLSGTHLVVKK